MNQPTATIGYSRATHLLAIATVVVALPLVMLGAEVTTKRVGMVDSVPLRTPWHMLTEWMNHHGLGWFVEHGHRTAGWLVGFLALGTAIVACCADRRKWVIGLAFAGGFAVLAQGALGYLRIQMNAVFGPSAAQIHGAFAPIVLATLMALAIATTRNWTVGEMASDKVRSLRIWCVIAAASVYVQIVLGGFVRHQDLLLAGRLHLIWAFVAFSFLWIAIKCARDADYESFKTLSRVIMGLLTVQILLGAEAWMAWMKRLFLPTGAVDESTAMQLVRSAHYLVGAFLFATTVAFAVKAKWAPARLEAAR